MPVVRIELYPLKIYMLKPWTPNVTIFGDKAYREVRRVNKVKKVWL